ncbi:homoserine kinase [Actinomycetospora aurantiaca]|uniref:homoserine kinase n=1 Tax=Actinomycetospora aurantiaca TaxID=3129233 RepID=UPI0035A04646
MVESGQRVRVRVPATSANLGPGFDSLGLALALHDEIELAELDGGPSVVEVHGEGAGRVPRDERHLVLKAACATYELAGVDRPPLHLTCHNTIPHSRGLGSSASAAVAGIVAACALLGPGKAPDDEAVLDLAARFDGHADNAAACLYGGLVVTWCSGGSYRAAHLEPHPDVVPVVFVSEHSSSTEATRGLLPDRVPHGDAAFTAARSALVVHALTRAPDLLLPATEDRLHQPYRRPAYPATAALVDALRTAGLAAVVSGAGPTVLALTTGEGLPDDLPTSGFETLHLPIDTAGATVTA